MREERKTEEAVDGQCLSKYLGEGTVAGGQYNTSTMAQKWDND